MRILVVGGGGREHALAWRLAQNPTVERLYAAPGNAGIARDATCLPIAADDVARLAEAIEREDIDLTVVGPESPLVAGLADELLARGRRVFGPTRDAARIEGSKAWAKDLCRRYGIPAPRSITVGDVVAGLEALDGFEPPYVVKVDGLAGGKGVVIAETREEARWALEAALLDNAFGEAGSRVLVEECLSGREVSAFALSDGRDVLPLALAQDFKRARDGDTGPNTGGMGAYSPVPFVDDATAERIWDDIVRRTIGALEAEGAAFQGVLYAGLMLTEDGPKVLEFNCRFGDPEAEVIVPRLRSDLGELFLACTEGNLSNYRAVWASEACVTVVMTAGGYPAEYATGSPIDGLDEAAAVSGVTVFHAGTQERDGRVVTSGGRVLAVSALGATIERARTAAYEACSMIHFDDAHYRRDIARRAAEEAT
ncbi:MAG TPA: phosphoribosylamine--glycine ligase [Actinomycetota bacterium]